jgi:hypothetical protein
MGAPELKDVIPSKAGIQARDDSPTGVEDERSFLPVNPPLISGCNLFLATAVLSREKGSIVTETTNFWGPSCLAPYLAPCATYSPSSPPRSS